MLIREKISHSVRVILPFKASKIENGLEDGFSRKSFPRRALHSSDAKFHEGAIKLRRSVRRNFR